MPLLLDTYNILHVVGVLPPDLAGVDVRGLAELIETSRYGGEDRLLVCDGAPAPGAPRGLVAGSRVVYTGHGRTADDHIMDFVAGSTAPRRVTVVTSDREIIRAVRKRRARTIDSATFLEHLAMDAEDASTAPLFTHDDLEAVPDDESPDGASSDEAGSESKWKALIDLGTAFMERENEAPLPADLAERLPSSKPRTPATPGEDRDDADDDAPPPPADVRPIVPDDVAREAGKIWREGRKKPSD